MTPVPHATSSTRNPGVSSSRVSTRVVSAWNIAGTM